MLRISDLKYFHLIQENCENLMVLFWKEIKAGKV